LPATTNVTIGALAPDFTLASTAGEDVTLSSHRGKTAVLLAFFPLAFTSTCTAELCDFSADYDLFEKAGVTVLPISVDATASLREFRSKYSMKTHLLSDFRRTVSQLYGVLNDERYYSNRAYFLVDKGGRVAWFHVESINKDKRGNEELLAEIQKLK
jgi:peroxiredoxin